MVYTLLHSVLEWKKNKWLQTNQYKNVIYKYEISYGLIIEYNGNSFSLFLVWSLSNSLTSC